MYYWHLTIVGLSYDGVRLFRGRTSLFDRSSAKVRNRRTLAIEARFAIGRVCLEGAISGRLSVGCNFRQIYRPGLSADFMTR